MYTKYFLNRTLITGFMYFFLYSWLVGVILVSRSRLVEEDAVMVFTCPFLF